MVVSAKVVGRGVDTLLLNVYYQGQDGKPLKADLSSGLVEVLNGWKDQAIAAERPMVVPWAFHGMHLHMHPHGAGRGQWSWLLTSDLINLCISRGRLNCLAMVRFSSEYLWSCASLLDAIKQVRRFLCDILGASVYLQVADGAVETHAYGLQRSGLAFSKHGPMSCSIYDKTREIRQKSGKTWFEDLWLANGWNDTGHVWRVEFRFKREALHELKIINGLHGIEDAFDLPECIPDLWAYAAGHLGGGADGWPDGWVRLVMPSTDDLNRSRWLVHPLCVEVQRAFMMDINPPENFHEVIRERKQQWNTDKAIEATMGFATSLAAHVGGDLAKPEADFSLFLHWLQEAGSDYLNFKSRDFAVEVQRKRVEFGLEVEGENSAFKP